MGLLRAGAAPELLPRLGQSVDRIVVFIAARERFGILRLDTGAIVLGPIGDAKLAVVLFDLVNPALANTSQTMRGVAKPGR